MFSTIGRKLTGLGAQAKAVSVKWKEFREATKAKVEARAAECKEKRRQLCADTKQLVSNLLK